jgi:hypothetical protein
VIKRQRESAYQEERLIWDHGVRVSVNGDTEKDGGRSGWWSKAAHIMAARKGREG